MPKTENWRDLEADLCELALEGGFMLIDQGGDKLAAPIRDRRANLTDLAQRLDKKGWKR